MNLKLTLTPELQAFVDQLIRKGRVADADEAINIALALWRDSETLEQGWDPDELRKEIAVGVGQADRGEFVDFSAAEIIEEGLKRTRAKKGA